MNKYRVMLNGRNFILGVGDGLAKHGFYTTRFVEASDPEEAEMKAVDSVRKREDIKPMLRNPADDPPMVYAEEIDELDTFDGINSGDQGFS